ncbi:hypothetical protein, partial [Staphylococcus aureus]
RSTRASFLMIRRPPRSTRVRSSAASDVYKRQEQRHVGRCWHLSLIHISEPTRHAQISYAVFCLKKGYSDETAYACLLYTSPSPRDMRRSRMPSSA